MLTEEDTAKKEWRSVETVNVYDEAGRIIRSITTEYSPDGTNPHLYLTEEEKKKC